MNPAVQRSFLGQVKSRDPYAHRLFEAVKPYEKRLKKDLLYFNEDELRQFLQKVSGTKEFPLYRALEILRQYGIYCKKADPPPLNAWKRIKADQADECRATMYAGPMHLADELDRVYLPLKEDNVDLLYRCFAWLAFGEAPYNIITLLKREDVDIANRRVLLQGQSFRIFEEALPLFAKVKEMDAFKVSEPNADVYIKRKWPEMFFSFMERGEYNPEGKRKTMMIKYSLTSRSTGASLTYGDIRTSGMFYRIFELERCMRISSPEEAFVYYETRGNDGKDTADKSVGWRAKKDMAARYKAWKQAFAV